MSDSNSEFRGRIYDDITQTIGATPLVRVGKLAYKVWKTSRGGLDF